MHFLPLDSTKWLHNPYFMNSCILFTAAVCSVLTGNLCHVVYPLRSSLIHCIIVFPIHMCVPYCFTGWLWRASCGTRRWCPHFGWCCIIRYWVWFKSFSWSLFKSVSLHRLDKESPQINACCVFLCRFCVAVCCDCFILFACGFIQWFLLFVVSNPMLYVLQCSDFVTNLWHSCRI